MYAKTDIRKFKAFVDGVSQVVDECSMTLGKDGIEIRALNPCNVTMLAARYNQEAFDPIIEIHKKKVKVEVKGKEEEKIEETRTITGYEYYPPNPIVVDGKEQGVQIGVDLVRLKDLLIAQVNSVYKDRQRKGYDKDDRHGLLEIECDEKERKMKLTVDGGITYTMALLDPATIRKNLQKPSIEYRAGTLIRADAFYDAVNTLNKIGSHIEFIATPDNHQLAIIADTVDDTKHTALRKRAEYHFNSVQFTTQRPGLEKSTYDAEFLLELATGAKQLAGKNADVEIEFTTDYPARISAGNDELSICYVMAPFLEE